MANPKAAWGIEIGAYAIKAIRLERAPGGGDNVTVSDFAVIPHKKVLTTPDLDQDEMVRLGLGQFISQKNLEGEHLVMSVPGHAAFARFAKLPPVEPKKVPDIVKFEAVQQIPFPIDEVEWDYQTFTSPDTPEIEVGIFAITRERVQQRLGLYAEVGMSPEVMTLSPVSVFNALSYDLHSVKHEGPVVYLDIGTQATDVIVSEAGRCWIRTFPLGGTHFTEAIASAFKLSYSKAEKLKLEASDSKYAKQIMQAMRPVFSDLLQDLQRSIGYYQSLHREHELKTMIGLGSTFKIPGLRKFLGQQLQIDVLRLDEYKRIQVTGREAAAFAENAVNMATAYGLALQGIGLSPINANLVPVKTLRTSMWQGKTKWFAAAAVIMLAGSAALLVRPMLDRSRMQPVPPRVVQEVLQRGTDLKNRFETLKARSDVGYTALNMVNLFDHRTIWPHLLKDTADALASTGPQPELLSDDVSKILSVPPGERNVVMLSQLEGDYVASAPGTGGPGASGKAGPAANLSRRVRVTMTVELSHDDPIRFLSQTVAAWLRQHAEPTGDRADVPYRIIVDTINTNSEKLATNTVSDDGAVVVAGATSTAGAQPPRQPWQPSGTPAPANTSGGRGLINPGALGTLQMPGMDDAPSVYGDKGTQTAPPTPPGSKPPGPPRPPGGPPNLGGRGGAGDAASGPDFNVEKDAPIPSRPQIYPPKSTFYTVPITFELEIIDPSTKPVPPSDAAASAQIGGAT
jgi:type IV pilus assembly protein PilM